MLNKTYQIYKDKISKGDESTYCWHVSKLIQEDEEVEEKANILLEEEEQKKILEGYQLEIEQERQFEEERQRWEENNRME